jgi:hypothetical protein
MLQNLTDKINACLEHCREAADDEPDERVRQQLIDLEKQWQDADVAMATSAAPTIRKRREAGESCRFLARSYGVSANTISRIRCS